MPVPPDEIFRFFVFVIESPSSVDLYHRRSEGEIIQQAANLNQIACVVKTSINYEAFEAALKIGLKEAMSSLPNLNPILHISAHGFEDGIQLSSGEIISWQQLAELIRPINDALGGYLLLCLSSCKGYQGVRMAMTLEDNTHPFYAIIANGEKPMWSDTAVAYSAFYHLMAKGHYVQDAVKGMQVASGNAHFWFETAESAKQGFIEHINNINSQAVQQKLEENAQKEDPGHLAKLAEISG